MFKAVEIMLKISNLQNEESDKNEYKNKSTFEVIQEITGLGDSNYYDLQFSVFYLTNSNYLFAFAKHKSSNAKC